MEAETGVTELVAPSEGVSPSVDDVLDHVGDIVSMFMRDWIAKYQKGQREHGGGLWLKGNMVDRAWEEALDLCSYLPTLGRQLAGLRADIVRLASDVVYGPVDPQLTAMDVRQRLLVLADHPALRTDYFDSRKA